MAEKNKKPPALPEGYHFTISICEHECSRALLDDLKQELINVARNIIRSRDLRKPSGEFVQTKVRLTCNLPNPPT